MGPLSQQLQATSSSESEPFSDRDLSHESLVGLPVFQYVPFFHTYGQLLDEEECPLQLEFCRDCGGTRGIREAQSWKDGLERPSGFFPYYRSKEETFPSLRHRGSQDPPTRKEVQAGCFYRRTVSSGRSAVSAGLDRASGSSLTCCPILLASARPPQDSGLDVPVCDDAALSGCALCASGYVLYYRTPEEWLHTSPGPPASPSGGPGAHRGAVTL